MRHCVLMLAAVHVACIAYAEADAPDCGFSKLHPRHITHFVERAALTRPGPDYPQDARDVGGKVTIRILVDQGGAVTATCPQFDAGKPRPLVSLVLAAEAAARRWVFAKNFGFDQNAHVQFDYIEGVLTFRFVPRPRPTVQSEGK